MHCPLVSYLYRMQRAAEFLTSHRNWILWLGIPLVTFLLHIHIFPKELVGVHAWRQTETTSNVVNFYERDFHPLHPQVHNLEWPEGSKKMEFPIMQWLMAWGYFLFGENIWIVRFLSFLIGLGTVFGMHRLVRHLFQDEFLALLSAWCMAFSPVFFYYTVNPLPDNLALMAGTWGIALFIKWVRLRDRVDLWLSAGFLLLATLAKLPFILFYGLPFGFALVDTIRSRFKRLPQNVGVALPGILSLAFPAAWYLSVIPTWTGNGVVGGILHATPDEYFILLKIFVKNIVSTLPELMINYGSFAFFVMGVYYLFRNKARKHQLWWAFAIWASGVGAYYLFEINMITTVHDYYLFPFLPGLFLILIYGLRKVWKWRSPWAQRFVFFAMLVLPLTAVLRTYPRWAKIGFSKDLITYREELRRAVPDDALVLAGSDLSPHIYLYHLHKRGWHLAIEEMEAERITNCIGFGAEYLYSDSREMEMHPALKDHLAEQVAEFGEFKVWRLK